MEPKIKEFVDSSVKNDFGLSIETIAEKCKTYGRFNAWLGQDVVKIKQVLNQVKSAGLSPAFFASYERTEGYNSKWGWLNHTVRKGDFYQDAVSVSNVVLNQSYNMSGNPSWIDYGNPVDFVPQIVKTSGNAHFKSLGKGTIGRALIPLTAAATWEVYYPNGLLKEYNQVQNYAKPINVMIDTIIAWGGSVSGGTVPEPDPENPVDPPDEDGGWNGIDVEKFSKEFKEKVTEMLSTNVFQSGTSEFYQNGYIQLMSQLENTYKVKATEQFYTVIDDLLGGINEELLPEPEPEPDPEPDPDPEPEPSTEWVFPVKIQNGINFFRRSKWGIGTLQRDMTYGVRANGGFHAGYDIGGGANGINHSVYALADSVVKEIRWMGTGGYAMVFEHVNDEYSSLYLHLVNNSAVVNVGDTVTAGQKVALMGKTGGSYPIHLHLELSKNGKFHNELNTVNPEPLLKITGTNTTELNQPS